MRVLSSNNEELELKPGIMLREVMILGRSIDGVDLTGSSLRDCYFNRSSMRNAVLRDCDLSGAVFFRTDLRGADLTGATLDACYWNEAVHDSSTTWPDGFRPPTSDQYLGLPEYSPPETGLCSPGFVPASQADVEKREWKSFVPSSIPAGDLDEPSKQILFLRLAVLFIRTFIPEDNDRSFLPFVMFDELPVDEANDDVMFTHICFMLKSIGIEPMSSLGPDSIRVRFSPIPHMRTITQSSGMHAFQILYERQAGVSFEEVATVDEFDDVEPAGAIDWCFLEDLGGGCSFTVEGTVRYQRGSSPITDPIHRIVDAMVRYMYMSSASWLHLGDDDDSIEHRNRSTQRVEDDFGWLAWHAVKLLSIHDVTAIDETTIEATISPRVDVRNFLSEIEEIDLDASSEPPWLDQMAAIPQFGQMARYFQ